MSAYVQSHEHISYLVDAAWHLDISWRWSDEMRSVPITEWTFADFQAAYKTARSMDRTDLGRILAVEQRLSVAYRYRESADLPGDTNALIFEYEHRPVMAHMPDGYDPVNILLAVSGYEYQSCEHPGWHTSEAKAITESIRDFAVSKVTTKAPRHYWGLNPEDVPRFGRVR